MFSFKYTPLVSMEVRHPYYKNLHAADIDFIPLPATIPVLDAYGLKARQADGNLLIYQKRDEEGNPFINIDKPADLYFLMQVKTDLLNITASFGKGRYWFSNLQEDGTYQQNMVLSADDEIPEIYAGQQMFNFPAGIVASLTLKRLAAPGGWTFVSSTPVDEQSGAAKITAPQPGMYQLEKVLKAGGKETMKVILSDELLRQHRSWAVLHLQVKPGDNNLAHTLTLVPRKSKWQYYLVEPFEREGSNLEPATLTISYSAAAPSRYPANMDISKKSPGDYSTSEKKYIDGLKNGGKIKEVYLFESQSEMEILDGEPPEVKLHRDGGKDWKITVPDRSMKNTIIIYKL